MSSQSPINGVAGDRAIPLLCQINASRLPSCDRHRQRGSSIRAPSRIPAPSAVLPGGKIKCSASSICRSEGFMSKSEAKPAPEFRNAVPKRPRRSRSAQSTFHVLIACVMLSGAFALYFLFAERATESSTKLAEANARRRRTTLGMSKSLAKRTARSACLTTPRERSPKRTRLIARAPQARIPTASM